MKEWEPYRFACPDCRERLRRDKEKWFICPRCKRIYEVGANAQLAAEAKIFSHAFRKIAMNVYALSLRKIAVPQKIAVRDCAVALLSQANEERTENSFCSRVRVEKDGTAWQEKNAACETYGRLRAFDSAVDIRKQSGLSDRYAVYVDAYTDDCSIRAVTESADVYYAKGTALYEEKQYSAAVAQFRSAAAVEHVGAQYMMGVCSEKGRGVMQNYPEAVRWYNLAAEQGNPDAQRRLGVCYEEGRGVARDVRKAAKWYRESAEQGDPDAQCLLGVCYQAGRGVPCDNDVALSWVRKSAAKDCLSGQTCLGIFYERGVGVAQDENEAMRWYSRAADRGSTDARRRLTALQAKTARNTRRTDGSRAVSKPYAATTQSGRTPLQPQKKSDINWVVFILLLLFFPIGALIYALVAGSPRTRSCIWIVLGILMLFVIVLVVTIVSCSASAIQ